MISYSMVWPPEFAPATPTEESEESFSGVRYNGFGDRNRREIAAHLNEDSGVLGAVIKQPANTMCG